MKKKIFAILLTLILCLPFVSLSALSKDVTSLSAQYKNGAIELSGEVDEGVLAVQIKITNKANETVLFRSIEVDEDNTFALMFITLKDDYVIEAANYDGGNIYTVYLFDSSEETNIIVSPEDSNSGEDKIITKEVEALANKILNNAEVTGISDELKESILNAINNGDNIVTGLETEEVKEEDISEDAEKINDLISKDTKIFKYLDITVPVKINGNTQGYITKLENNIEISIDLPSDLPKVKEGFTRTYKVIKVHNGVASAIDAEVKNEKLTFKTNEFSTYALTYTDVKNPDSPTTGDDIMTYVYLLGISVLFLGFGLAYNIKRKSLK